MALVVQADTHLSGPNQICPTCYILLPVHNRRRLTEQFVADLQAQTYRQFHLVLIDDGSTDGTATMVQAQLTTSLTILQGEGDWWWAGSLQQGIQWLRWHSLRGEDIVLMINDDVRIAPNFLELGIDLLTPHSLLQAEGCGELDRGVVADLTHLTFTPAPTPEQVNCLTTRGLFIRWQDLQHIGDFYPRWLPHYLSDFEFTIRAHRRGLTLFTHPDLKLQVNPTTTGLHQLQELTLKSVWQRYFSRRSSANKLDWSAFILLACPRHRWLTLLAKIWLGGFPKLWQTLWQHSPI